MTELLVATGDGFARITERGGEWRVASALSGRGVQCLALDPQQTGTLYAGSRGQGVWKSEDGARTWARTSLLNPMASRSPIAVVYLTGSLRLRSGRRPRASAADTLSRCSR